MHATFYKRDREWTKALRLLFEELGDEGRSLASAHEVTRWSLARAAREHEADPLDELTRKHALLDGFVWFEIMAAYIIAFSFAELYNS
jgi:hypothetical protein